MKKKLLLLCILLTCSFRITAQFSKTHYIPPLSSTDVISGDQFLYISTPSLTPINFKIIEIGGSVIEATVSRNSPYEHSVGFGNDTQLHLPSLDMNQPLNNKGYIIEAEDQIYVSARVIDSQLNQAGQVVSKGLAALGQRFRIGAFTNTQAQNYSTIHTTFISVMATENSTVINFSDFKPGITLIGSPNGDTPFSITLNSGESYVIGVQGPNENNRDGLIGTLVTSDKPIAVNCGSFGGTNGEMSNLDLGFDQIVPAERLTTNEYIFIKSTGMDNVEVVLLVADEDNTEIFLNDFTIPSYTLNAGEYVVINGGNFDANGNLFIRATKKIFAYQSVGDSSSGDQRNQELFFVPPLSCQTPRIIDNIPLIDRIGSFTFSGRVTLVTEFGSTLNFTIDGTDYALSDLPFVVNGPNPVIGNTGYETYVITGLTGNVAVRSTGELYLAAYGTRSAATFGGFYSGFTFEPEVSFKKLDVAQESCIPNTFLSVNSLSPFDVFQWYFNGTPIPGANESSYQPPLTAPGFYKVSATISSCTIPIESAEIPVSSCTKDDDNDGVNNNVDFDKDNDGLTNCDESHGNVIVDMTNPLSGNVSSTPYSNNFNGTITFVGLSSSNPITDNTAGNFVIQSAVGKNNSTRYTQTYTQPISLSVQYGTQGAPEDYLSSASELRFNCPVNKTLTLLNPDNQVLVDTNYDGIYESGITQYSSFEIRIRLNGSIELEPGTGTFSINGEDLSQISIQNINLIDTNPSRVVLRIVATCLPKDSDNDGIPDQNDFDSDNDGLPDSIEVQAENTVLASGNDVDGNGIDDAYGNGLSPADTDNDGVNDYLDLDSDNDGIFDLKESGSNTTDTNQDGRVDGINFGSNGLADTLETSLDSNSLNFSISDSNSDGVYDAISLESDGDGCNDVIEGGYTDANQDGLLGNASPPEVDQNGLVTGFGGYLNPSNNFSISAPITINLQPQNISVCEEQTAVLTVDTSPVDSYRWQFSTDNGTTWTDLTDGPNYTGTSTISLSVLNVTPEMSSHEFRVFLNKIGNSCGLYSASCKLTVLNLPDIISPVSLKQCDDDTDGNSVFNLTQKNDFISNDAPNQTFKYYTTFAGADTADTSFEINNPTAYPSSNGTIYVRVENSNGCHRVALLNLIVSVTQIPNSFTINDISLCDDYLDPINNDRDGISGPFNFSNIEASLLSILPNNVSIKFYRNEADFLAETNLEGNSLAISDITNYRNIGYPNQQKIWVRVDSTLDNSCYGFRTFDLFVEKLPVANNVNPENVIRKCDDNQDGIFGFDVTDLEATILQGQTNVSVSYQRSNGTVSSTLPNPFFVSDSETVIVRVTNNITQTANGQPCYDEVEIQFLVDDLPEAFEVPVSLTSICDDETDPVFQDGILDFNTVDFQNIILGSQSNVAIYYYDQSNNLLNTPPSGTLPNPFTSGTQTLKVIVENTINTSCKAEVLIPLTVLETPKIDLRDSFLICLPDDEITINAALVDGSDISNYTYQWFQNGSVIVGETNYELVVDTEDTYSVVVTNGFGCSMTRSVQVTDSEAPTFEDVIIQNQSGSNTVEIVVSGSGNYEYSLTGLEGPYRDSSIFNNVPMGFHEAYVNDKNGCGNLGPIQVAVLGIPAYFTPNADGYHDTWNIKGALANENDTTVIRIFDRYGKLLKQISALGEGWDGTYNGKPLPSDDYWFTILFENGKEIKGHFALKR